MTNTGQQSQQQPPANPAPSVHSSTGGGSTEHVNINVGKGVKIQPNMEASHIQSIRANMDAASAKPGQLPGQPVAEEPLPPPPPPKASALASGLRAKNSIKAVEERDESLKSSLSSLQHQHSMKQPLSISKTAASLAGKLGLGLAAGAGGAYFGHRSTMKGMANKLDEMSPLQRMILSGAITLAPEKVSGTLRDSTKPSSLWRQWRAQGKQASASMGESEELRPHLQGGTRDRSNRMVTNELPFMAGGGLAGDLARRFYGHAYISPHDMSILVDRRRHSNMTGARRNWERLAEMVNMRSPGDPEFARLKNESHGALRRFRALSDRSGTVASSRVPTDKVAARLDAILRRRLNRPTPVIGSIAAGALGGYGLSRLFGGSDKSASSMADKARDILGSGAEWLRNIPQYDQSGSFSMGDTIRENPGLALAALPPLIGAGSDIYRNIRGTRRGMRGTRRGLGFSAGAGATLAGMHQIDYIRQLQQTNPMAAAALMAAGAGVGGVAGGRFAAGPR